MEAWAARKSAAEGTGGKTRVGTLGRRLLESVRTALAQRRGRQPMVRLGRQCRPLRPIWGVLRAAPSVRVLGLDVRRHP